jgi:hypothetical protein
MRRFMPGAGPVDLVIAAIWLVGQCNVFIRYREELALPPISLTLNEPAVDRLFSLISGWAIGGHARRRERQEGRLRILSNLWNDGSMACRKDWKPPVFAGGALDDPSQIEISDEMYASEALPWARLECPISSAYAPDPTFIKGLSEKARLSRQTG